MYLFKNLTIVCIYSFPQEYKTKSAMLFELGTLPMPKKS